MRTRPNVSSALLVRKYGLCNLVDAMSASIDPIEQPEHRTCREEQHRPATRRINRGALGRRFARSICDGSSAVAGIWNQSQLGGV